MSLISCGDAVETHVPYVMQKRDTNLAKTVTAV